MNMHAGLVQRGIIISLMPIPLITHGFMLTALTQPDLLRQKRTIQVKQEQSGVTSLF